VGVAWKLAWATAKVLSGSDRVTDRLREFLLESLSLVAVGTVADCAALTGENRILVHHGLQALARTANPGLKALREHARLEGDIVAGDVGWKLGPLLNASGRVGSAMANIRLLTDTDEHQVKQVLTEIVAENEERKRLTAILTADLMAEVERNPAYAQRASLVFAGEGWHAGVVGIVASRLVEAFGKPAVVIAIEDGTGKGSMRSVPHIHLGEALAACRPLILKGGGHAMAAGMTIATGQVPAFIEAFENHVASRLPAGANGPRTEYDGEVALAELDEDFFHHLEAMAPFGTANPEPVLQLRQATFVTRPRLFGRDGDHLRGAVTDVGGGMRELLAWRAKDRLADFAIGGGKFDLLVRPQAGHWRGEMTPQLIFVDGKSC
jgi:single-stranded-DNA-specific exonuclease